MNLANGQLTLYPFYGQERYLLQGDIFRQEAEDLYIALVLLPLVVTAVHAKQAVYGDRLP